MELVCPAGTPASLHAAVEAGADVVYCGFRDETNARNFPGLNFSRNELLEGVKHAHKHGVHVYLACNTYPTAGMEKIWHDAIDDAAAIGVDAIILADIGLLRYARDRHPKARLHLSVQASASNEEAIKFYHREFGVQRVVLPRVLSLEEIRYLNLRIPVETEVFAFGGMCVMAEGRCSLSSYATGESPNMNGVCSPAAQVHYEERDGMTVSRLGNFTVNIYDQSEKVGYPTLCKGRFRAMRKAGYLFEEPTSLDVTAMLPELADAGVTALKIEGRQRGKAYISQVVSAFRTSLDLIANGGMSQQSNLKTLTEGQSDTTGAYRRNWQ
ncbi:U32 family peptidase [Thalassospira sp. MA62]|nr:U32 family peptidase [Thalassospira sp. MA62]